MFCLVTALTNRMQMWIKLQRKPTDPASFIPLYSLIEIHRKYVRCQTHEQLSSDLTWLTTEDFSVNKGRRCWNIHHLKPYQDPKTSLHKAIKIQTYHVCPSHDGINLKPLRKVSGGYPNVWKQNVKLLLMYGSKEKTEGKLVF